MFATTPSQICAEACVPEQLPHYVQSISGRRFTVCSGYAAYLSEGHAVLVAYPGSSATQLIEEEAARLCVPNAASVSDYPARQVPSLTEALEKLHGLGYGSVSVLSPCIPGQASKKVVETASADIFWQLPLPAQRPGGKLRNMLIRAGREIHLNEEKWNTEHNELVAYYLRTRPLPGGTRVLFSSLGSYVNGAEKGLRPEPFMPGDSKVLLLAARKGDGSLAAFAVGDFSALETAFYMFAFRYPDAPPGTADLLLSGLVRHAEKQGHRRMNLGLGISSGIGFFKKKWGALPYLPYVETQWQLTGTSKSEGGFAGLLRRLLS